MDVVTIYVSEDLEEGGYIVSDSSGEHDDAYFDDEMDAHGEAEAWAAYHIEELGNIVEYKP